MRLNLNETKKLLILWRENNNEQALITLINCNTGLIIKFANMYSKKGIEYSDLFSAGKEGLLNAINHFDYNNRDIKLLSTYISVSIINNIRKDFKKFFKHNNVISVNQKLKEIEENDYEYIDNLIDNTSEVLFEKVLDKLNSEIIMDTLQNLTDKEREIILLRFGLFNNQQSTLSEIAKRYNCSKSMVSKYERKALKKLKLSKTMENLYKEI